jgi:pectin methylesterase-like acyl-CoA thioesterase
MDWGMLRIHAPGLLFAAGSRSAQVTLVVDATGRNGNYRTIGAAVTAAKNRDRIVIHPGVYTESVTLKKKVVSLIGFLTARTRRSPLVI